MSAAIENWCQQDGHADFELFEDFNDWINEGEVDIESPLLEKLLSIGLSTPSKAFLPETKRPMSKPSAPIGLRGAMKLSARYTSLKTLALKMVSTGTNGTSSVSIN